MNNMAGRMLGVIAFLCCCFWVAVCIADTERPEIAKDQLILEKKQSGASVKEEKLESTGQAKEETLEKTGFQELLGDVNLPEDTTPRLTVSELRITGNTLVSTDELLANMPLIYNSVSRSLRRGESVYLYDFRTLRDIILNPGQPRQVSSRTIQGFTQYILSVYQNKNYGGVYVYVPADAVKGGMELENGILPIKIIEAPVAGVTTRFYDPNQNVKVKGYLRDSFIQGWSPVKVGQVANQKQLNDFVNLLNLDPDRYVSAVISKGAEPNSLFLRYDIYEANPWHYFIQVDNAGTEDRQWAPRLGLINTNLLGFDDRFTGVIQGPVDSDPKDNYTAYASYEFPVFTPRLRLSVYGARSEFDIAAAQDIDFLGKGSLYGSTLRFNAFQKDNWFFDVLGSLRHEKSKITPSLFPQIFGSEVAIDLWGIGFDIHRSSDISNTSLMFNRLQSFGGSSQEKFWDPTTLTGARTNSDRDFTILTLSAAHNRFLNANKIHRVLGSFTYIRPNARLAPVEMTIFGGMYTVRGYEENEIVADGGALASIQYEYDLVKAGEAKEPKSEKTQGRKPWLRRLAPVGFFDWGRADVRDAVAGEKGTQYLYSIGPGLLAEIGDNFNAALYYGFPLKKTQETDKGDGRLNVSLMMKW